jgi:hypothetical protein
LAGNTRKRRLPWWAGSGCCGPVGPKFTAIGELTFASTSPLSSPEAFTDDDPAANAGDAQVRPTGPRGMALALIGLALGAVEPLNATADEAPLPPPRPPDLAAPGKAPAEPLAPPLSKTDAVPICLTKLIADGASAEAATAPPASAEGCGIDAPVQLSSIMAKGAAVSLPDRPLVACAFAAALADYVRLVVAPLGEATLHAKVAAIETGPGYDCRTQDRVAGAKISAHAKGLAVDFTAITLADKRRILVERQTGADEASYFRAIRMAACGWFTTVLGPGADSFHANNMHFDTEQHGSSGSYRICR